MTSKNSSPKLGKFDHGTSRSAGRLIDTWTYRSGLPGQEPLEVKVNLVSPKDGEYRFVAHCKAFGGPVDNSDLTRLRQEVDTLLQDWCTDRSGLVWEDWLEVQVSGRARAEDGAHDMGLTIRYRTLPQSVLPDGRVVTVNSFGRIVAFPKPHQTAGNIDTQELILDDRTSGAEISYIRSTPEALASLELLQSRLDHLRLSLSRLLTQESIAEKLSQLAAAPLALPGAPEDGGAGTTP